MNKQRMNISRRDFLIQTTTLGAGFSLGLYLPLSTHAAQSAARSSSSLPEVNAWVVIQPDDTKVKKMPGVYAVVAVENTARRPAQRLMI